MDAREAIDRLRSGDLGHSPFARLTTSSGGSVHRSFTTAALAALRQSEATLAGSFTDGIHDADVFAIDPTATNVGLTLLVVRRDGTFVDVAATHDRSAMLATMPISTNPLIRALDVIPGSPTARLKSHMNAMRASMFEQALVLSALGLALEAEWPEREPTNVIQGGGNARFGSFASCTASAAEWTALDDVRRISVRQALAEVARRLQGLVRPGSMPSDFVVGIRETTSVVTRTETSYSMRMTLGRGDQPWLFETTVTPRAWRVRPLD